MISANIHKEFDKILNNHIFDFHEYYKSKNPQKMKIILEDLYLIWTESGKSCINYEYNFDNGVLKIKFVLKDKRDDSAWEIWGKIYELFINDTRMDKRKLRI